MKVEGNRKLIVSVMALLVVGVVATWGSLSSEEVSTMLKWVIPTIIGAFTAGNIVEHKMNKN